MSDPVSDPVSVPGPVQGSTQYPNTAPVRGALTVSSNHTANFTASPTKSEYLITSSTFAAKVSKQGRELAPMIRFVHATLNFYCNMHRGGRRTGWR